jgi:hypothetical protein
VSAAGQAQHGDEHCGSTHGSPQALHSVRQHGTFSVKQSMFRFTEAPMGDGIITS